MSNTSELKAFAWKDRRKLRSWNEKLKVSTIDQNKSAYLLNSRIFPAVLERNRELSKYTLFLQEFLIKSVVFKENKKHLFTLTNTFLIRIIFIRIIRLKIAEIQD